MRIIATVAAFTLVATAAWAEPTRVMVRARSMDAKFIGDQMGGVAVTLRDARTGRVLARGATAGGTGDTGRLMRTPQARGATLTDASTAGFDAVVDIDAPTLVEAEAVGPAGKPQSQIRVTSQMWVFPGRDVVGDGWVLTFPGLVVEPDLVGLTSASPSFAAKVSLMCGCPIEPKGLWDADNYTVEAELRRGGAVVSRTRLAYAGKPSTFTGSFGPGVARGRYRLRITATDSTTPNAGVWESDVRID
jgi:hypothetical protein